jgi:beta-lactamase superfamily II metal-dependent hydrolase
VPFGGPLLQGSTTRLHDLQVNVLGPSVAAMAELAEKWRASVAAKNLKAIAAAYADRSVPNLSSIALHLGFGGRSGLLTGDARGDHLLTGLEAVALLVPGKTIHVDVLKLPHHGSEYNAGRSMFERVRADHYVVCADGIKHDHPSKATLEWLVSSRAVEDTYTIHLTNPIPAAEAILKELGVGRSFKVAVGRPYVRIVLTDMARC